MILSSKVKNLTESITQKLNEKASDLTDEGKIIYNLSGGQLPIKPIPEFVEKINHQTNFLKSYQYSPVSGFSALRKKFMAHHLKQRSLSSETFEENFDCIISNGSKHSLYLALSALIDSGDEVILLTPYWVSYPQMIRSLGGVSVEIKTNAFDAFVPALEDIEKAMTPKTKAIIINSPNNPAGIHYSEKWMSDFANFLKSYPDLVVISDEVYSEITYFDPKPTYFYQKDPSLLKQTVIIHAISKSLAATGLRIGYTIAPSDLIKGMSRIQGQTTSGPNSLIQRALIDFDLSKTEAFLGPVCFHIRQNASYLREKFRKADLAHCWYQSTSAFYFMVDFSRTPMFERFKEEGDYSYEIADELLEKMGIAVVPGTDFGVPNSARIAFVIDEIPFQEAISKLMKYLLGK